MDELELFLTRIFDNVITPIITVLFFLATALMLFGLVEYLAKSSEAEGRTEGRRHMFWGMMGLVIMFSAVALVNIICSFFGNQCSTFLNF